jgi:predicted RNA-binding Zn-ribbon protein involved in translation (DUF1610 family)
MLFPVAMVALLGAGLLLVVYGTVARNRWGINLAKVSCPNCSTPLTGTRTQKTRSLKQAMWGGYRCPVCGAEVDKWGRQAPRRDKLQDESRNFWTKQRKNGFKRLRDAPALFWVFGSILLALDLWWDLYHPRGFVLDVTFLILAFVFYRRCRKEHSHTNS